MSFTPFYIMHIRLCNKAGKSACAVAQEIGLNKSTVTRWKHGAMPKDANLFRIAEYFALPVNIFMEQFGCCEKCDMDEFLE